MWKAVLMFPIPLGCDASHQIPMNNAVARVSLLHSCRRCHRSHLRFVEFTPVRNSTGRRRGEEGYACKNWAARCSDQYSPSVLKSTNPQWPP